MRDLLLPRTDAGVLVQLVIVVVLIAVGLAASWRRRDARFLVGAAGFLVLTLFGVRAAH